MTSLLSPADNATVTTVTKLEIELQRTETVTQITCSQCSRTGEVRKVEFAPPASIGSAISFQRVPDGWWLHGSAMFSVKGTCPHCFEQRSSVRADSEEAGAPSTREEPHPKATMDSDHDRPVDSLGEPPPFDAASIIEGDAPEPQQNSANAAAAQDLFERVERVCKHGGSVLVSGSSLFNEATRRAHVKMSNDHGIDLTASATGKTMIGALESALAKAGL
jgi:hypothetical protein